MSLLKPNITVQLFGKDRKKNEDVTSIEEPGPDVVEIAEEAASRIGKKLVIGAIVVVASHVILTTVSEVIKSTYENYLTNK